MPTARFDERVYRHHTFATNRPMIDADKLYREADRLANLTPAQIRREAIFHALVIGEHAREAGETMERVEEGGKSKADTHSP